MTVIYFERDIDEPDDYVFLTAKAYWDKHGHGDDCAGDDSIHLEDVMQKCGWTDVAENVFVPDGAFGIPRLITTMAAHGYTLVEFDFESGTPRPAATPEED